MWRRRKTSEKKHTNTKNFVTNCSTHNERTNEIYFQPRLRSREWEKKGDHKFIQKEIIILK